MCEGGGGIEYRDRNNKVKYTGKNQTSIRKYEVNKLILEEGSRQGLTFKLYKDYQFTIITIDYRRNSTAIIMIMEWQTHITYSVE